MTHTPRETAKNSFKKICSLLGERVVKYKSAVLSIFVGKKLDFFKKFNFFVILAYKLHNKILILEKFDDFFKKFFSVVANVLDYSQ